jgi:hypothetical protein
MACYADQKLITPIRSWFPVDRVIAQDYEVGATHFYYDWSGNPVNVQFSRDSGYNFCCEMGIFNVNQIAPYNELQINILIETEMMYKPF